MSRTRSVAHLSDLHFGLTGTVARTRRIVESIRHAGIDHVVVTGDVTHRGRLEEYGEFLETFSPLLLEGRVTLVPGNHDRWGDDLASTMTGGERVRVRCTDGFYFVLVDSSAPHNRLPWASHGMITPSDLTAIDGALDLAPRGTLVVIMMHHHPYPLPEESALERISSLVGLPYALELEQGRALLDVATGRCDLVLHGHRHVPRALRLGGHRRPLRLLNAGSSTELCAYRVLEAEQGRLADASRWIALPDRQPHGEVYEGTGTVATG